MKFNEKQRQKKVKSLYKKYNILFQKIMDNILEALMAKQQFLLFCDCFQCPIINSTLDEDNKFTERSMELMTGCSRSIAVVFFLRNFLETFCFRLKAIDTLYFDYRIFEIIQNTCESFTELLNRIEESD